MIVDALRELNNGNGSDSATITRCIELEGKYGARFKPRHARRTFDVVNCVSGSQLSVIDFDRVVIILTSLCMEMC